MFHPLRRIRAILSLGVTGLLFALAMLPLKSTDFIDFSLLPFLYILPFIVVLLLLTAIIDDPALRDVTTAHHDDPASGQAQSDGVRRGICVVSEHAPILPRPGPADRTARVVVRWRPPG